MRVVIFAGRKEVEIDYMKKYLREQDYIIACDGGLETIDKLGVKPNILIGDFDSTSDLTLNAYKNIKKITYKKDKDFSDLELTLQYCETLKAIEVIVFGAMGGRLDHSLSNITLIKKYSELGLDIKYYDNDNEIFVAKNNITIKKSKAYLSLIPFGGECIVSLKGVLFELDNKRIDEYQTLTISNEIIEEFAYLDIHKGKTLIIQSNPI